MVYFLCSRSEVCYCHFWLYC